MLQGALCGNVQIQLITWHRAAELGKPALQPFGDALRNLFLFREAGAHEGPPSLQTPINHDALTPRHCVSANPARRARYTALSKGSNALHPEMTQQ